MSSRRLNRTGSRTTRSRRSSISELMTDVPNSSVQIPYHPENSVLPSVETKLSCAYGANSLAQPRRTLGPQNTEKLSSVLHKILDPKTTVNNSYTRTQSPSPAPVPRQNSYSHSISDYSFDIESDIYNDASIESSVIDLTETYETDPSSSDDGLNELTVPSGSQSMFERREPENSVQHAYEPPPIHQTPQSKYFSKFSVKLNGIRCVVRPWNFSKIIILAGGLLLAIYLNSSHNKFSISSLAPYLPDSRSSVFLVDEASSIRRRLGKLEADLSQIKKRTSDIDFTAVKELQRILPENIVLKKANGTPQISDDLWKEIITGTRSGKLSLESISDASDKIESIISTSSTLSDKFLRENEAKIRQIYDKNLTRRFPQLLHDYEIIPKADIIDLISENWEKNRIQIFAELRDLAPALSDSLKRNSVPQISEKWKREMKNLAVEVFNQLPGAQLHATAQVNILNGITYTSMKADHFCVKLGAVVDKHNTSPGYLTPEQSGVWLIERLMRNKMGNVVTKPNSPETALNTWTEQGECWCTALEGSGFGPSLGILTTHRVFPEEIVVEHVPSLLATHPGSTPKDLELLVQIDDPEIESVIEGESKKFFPDQSDDPKNKIKGYVLIAAWAYELNASSYVQKHEIPLNLKAFGVDTNRFIFRIKSNWSGGDLDHVCLYRVRLHGPISHLAESSPKETEFP